MGKRVVHGVLYGHDARRNGTRSRRQLNLGNATCLSGQRRTGSRAINQVKQRKVVFRPGRSCGQRYAWIRTIGCSMQHAIK
jgi:hypothetical protein